MKSTTGEKEMLANDAHECIVVNNSSDNDQDYIVVEDHEVVDITDSIEYEVIV